MSRHLKVGQTGEDLAVEHLTGLGMRILERNHRTVFGEIDVICLDRGTVVFVEVKTRTSTAFADPADAVDHRKVRHLSRAALHYLASKSWEDRLARFDVLSVSWQGDRPVIEHIADAFDPVVAQVRIMLRPGILYVMATPLGNLEDLTWRGAKLIKEAAVIAAEDTRRTRKLVNHLGSRARLISYREQNHARILPKLLEILAEGQNVVLVSDAGTPGISDPGAMVVREVAQRGFKVLPIPGPSAVATALSVSGLPSDSFLFVGFLPTGGNARRSILSSVKALPYTLVFFEAPHRVFQFLDEAIEVLGDRQACLGREMTKMNEEYLRGSLSEIAAAVARKGEKPRGEITMVVSGSKHDVEHELSAEELEKLVMEDQRHVKDIVRDLSGFTSLARSDLYRLVLKLKGQQSEPGPGVSGEADQETSDGE